MNSLPIFHRAILYRQLVEILLRLEEKSAYLDAARILLAQIFHHVVDAVSRFDDILDDNYVATLDVEIDAQMLRDFARGLGAFVRRNLDERQFVVELDFAHEVGKEHERAAQHAYENRRTLARRIVGIDSPCDSRNGFVDFFRQESSLRRYGL